MSDDDEFDNLPDEFADIEGVDWSEILSGAHPPPTHLIQDDHVELPRIRSLSSNSSTSYSYDEGMDSAFLAELDDLERNATRGGAGPSRDPASSSIQNTRVAETAASSRRRSASPPHSNPGTQFNSHSISFNARDSQPSLLCPARSPKKRREFEGDDYARPPAWKRSRSEASPLGFHSPNKKGKAKATGDEVLEILSNFEDELTCPICSDILVAAHLGNPCGHTFCGECGWQWKKKGKNNCAICRTVLSRTTPMIPNYAMDNTVEKHICILGQSGVDEWKRGGAKHIEWIARKERWKKDVAERARAAVQQKKGKQKATAIVNLRDFIDVDMQWFIADDEEDEDYVEEEEDVEVISSRRWRRRER